MAIATSAVTRAQCDACPQVVYAEGEAEPKGIQGTAREVDGNGAVTVAEYFACQLGHVGAAARNTLKAAREAARRAPAPTAVPAAPKAVPDGKETPVSLARTAS